MGILAEALQSERWRALRATCPPGPLCRLGGHFITSEEERFPRGVVGPRARTITRDRHIR
jgi:hypothetical protein